MQRHLLELMEGSEISRRIPVHRTPFRIGRGTENDLVLFNASVSRYHATLIEDTRGLTILDNNSRNGVFVNGERVTGRRTLLEGDLLRTGSSEMRVRSTIPTETLTGGATGTFKFFPSSQGTHLLSTLTEGHPFAGPSSRGKSGRSWQQILRLLTEAPLPQMFETIFDVVEELVAYDRCYLCSFVNGSPDELRILAQRFRAKHDVQSEVTSPEMMLSREVLRRVAQHREAVLVTLRDAKGHTSDSFIQSGACAAICFPLVTRDRVLGVLYLDRLLGSPEFSPEAVKAVDPLAGLLALKVENFELLDGYLTARIDRRDLDIAEKVQRRFMREELPSLPGYEIEGYTRPCRQVGGDFFDFTVHHGELALAMGDVSGKGLPSALYMVGVLSTFRAHAQDGIDLQTLMRRLERYVRANFHPDHFLTFFAGRLDAASGTIRWCNAGHLLPVVVSPAGAVRFLAGGDPAFNILPWQDFQCFECRLDPGDLLCVYTDGLVEASRDGEGQFGDERLVECLKDHPEQDLSVLRKRVFAAVEAFAAGNGAEDDKSIVLVRRADMASRRSISGGGS